MVSEAVWPAAGAAQRIFSMISGSAADRHDETQDGTRGSHTSSAVAGLLGRLLGLLGQGRLAPGWGSDRATDSESHATRPRVVGGSDLLR